MAENQHSDIFSDTECLSMDLMERYAGDQLSAAEQQAVEKHLVDCPICSDAMEGLSLAGFSGDVTSRIASLNERIAATTAEASTGFWKKEYNAYAAGLVGILLVSAFMINYLNNAKLNDQNIVSDDLPLDAPIVTEEASAPVDASEPVEENGELEKMKWSDTVRTAAVNGGSLNDQSNFTSDLGNERRLDQKLDKEGKALTTDLLTDQSSEGASNVEIRGDKVTFGYTFSSDASGKTDESAIAEDSETDNKSYRNESDDRFQRDEGVKSEREISGLDKNAVSGRAESEATVDLDVMDEYYKSKDESKKDEIVESITESVTLQESKALEKSGEYTENVAQPTTTTGSIAVEKDTEPASVIQTVSKSSKVAANKKSTKGRANSPDYGYIADGKKKEQVIEKAEEYDDPNTLYNAVTPSTEVAPEETVLAAELKSQADTVKAILLPAFQGGESNLKQYLSDNVVYPKAAGKLGIEGQVQVKFKVNADSTISNVEVIMPIGGGCDEEAIRVVNAMPNWEPAQRSGKEVSSEYELSIDFQPHDSVVRKKSNKRSDRARTRAKF